MKQTPQSEEDTMVTNKDTSRRSVLLAGATLAIASTIDSGTTPAAHADALNPQPLPPSPDWSRAMPPGPDARVKITEEYARHVGKDAYFWAWPMVNMYNRRLHFLGVKEMVLLGPLMESPANRLVMLTDYVIPEERAVACPNQDVVYGIGALALDITPVVIQAPDFGDRFWVYQVVDLRTDSFVQLGKMYGTRPGFYLLVGTNWNREVPKGISRVFRCSTNSGLVAPRVAQEDTPEDKRAIQTVLPGIMMYPIAEYDGKIKTKDWANLPKAPAPLWGDEETPCGLSRTSSSTNCHSFSPTHRRYPARSTLRAGTGGTGCRKEQFRDEAGDDRGRKGSRREAGETAVPVPKLWPAAPAQLEHHLQRVGVRH
jgi:hypothetical protein